MELNNRLKEYRERAGLTQEQLAEQIGVQRNTVWRWENNRATMKADLLRRLSEILNVEPAILIKSDDTVDRKDDPDTQPDTNNLVFEWGGGKRLILPNTPETREIFERLVGQAMLSKQTPM